MGKSLIKTADQFAGAGGFSTGAEMAGCETVWAGNHWPAACNIFEANHGVKPACQDLQQANWWEVPAFDLLLASPACQGHSRARGPERPHHDALRSTAWAVVSCLEAHGEAEAGLVENVPEFLDWTLYPAWVDALRRLGWAASPHIANAADHGAPQERKRVLIALTRSQAPIKLALPKRPARTARDVIRFDRGAWSPIHKPGRSLATLQRIQNGRRQFGDRFVMPYYSSGSGLTGRSLDRPIGTITTKNRWGVVDGDRMRMLITEESRDFMGFPEDYILPPGVTEATFMLGNAVYPQVATDFIEALRAQA